MVFYASVPSAGRYHLFLDFRHRGVVRTAGFVLDAAPGVGQPTGFPSPTGSPTEGSHGDY